MDFYSLGISYAFLSIMNKILSILLLASSLVFSSMGQAGENCIDLFEFAAKTTAAPSVLTSAPVEVAKEAKPKQKIEIVEKDLSASSKEEVNEKVKELLLLANQTLNEGIGRKFTEDKGEMRLGINLPGNRSLELSYSADRRGSKNRFILERVELIRANGVAETLTKEPLKHDKFKLKDSSLEFNLTKEEMPADLGKIEIPTIIEGPILEGLLKYTNHFEFLTKKEIQSLLDKKQYFKLDALYRYRATKKFLIKTVVVKIFRNILLGGVMIAVSTNPIVGIVNHHADLPVETQRTEMVLQQAPYLTGELAGVSKVEASRLGQEIIQAAKTGAVSQVKQSIFTGNQTVNMHQLVTFNNVKDANAPIVQASESIWVAQGQNQEVSFIFVKAGVNPSVNGDVVAVVQLDLHAYPDLSSYFNARYFSGAPVIDIAP
jgi:hypothetical protein